MALCASGTMALGGATTGRSVNLELGCSATAAICMNRTDVRTLAEVASGAISMSDFYGKSSVPPPPTTLGTYYSDYGGYYTGTQSGYYLFASSVFTNGTQWKTTNSNSNGTTSGTNGYSNTYAQKNATHPLFNCVGSLTTAGFSDWYIGSCCELQQLITNRNCGSLNGSYSGWTWVHSSTQFGASGTQANCVWSVYWPTCWLDFGTTSYKTCGHCSRPIRRSAI